MSEGINWVSLLLVDSMNRMNETMTETAGAMAGIKTPAEGLERVFSALEAQTWLMIKNFQQATAERDVAAAQWAGTFKENADIVRQLNETFRGLREAVVPERMQDPFDRMAALATNFRVSLESLEHSARRLRNAWEAERMTRRDMERAKLDVAEQGGVALFAEMKEKWKDAAGSLEEARKMFSRAQEEYSDVAPGFMEAKGAFGAEINEIQAKRNKEMQPGAMLDRGMQGYSQAMGKMGMMQSMYQQTAMGQFQEAFLKPLKELPKRIGQEFSKLISRPLEPFLNLISMFVDIFEPFVAVIEIYLTPLMQALGQAAARFAESLLGSPETIDNLISAGEDLVRVVTAMYETMKALGAIFTIWLRTLGGMKTPTPSSSKPPSSDTGSTGGWEPPSGTTVINIMGSLIPERKLRKLGVGLIGG